MSSGGFQVSSVLLIKRKDKFFYHLVPTLHVKDHCNKKITALLISHFMDTP